MPKLSTATRKQLPARKFGLPKQRKYPITDPEHAHLAESYATQEYDKGDLSLSELAQIRRKAKRELAK